MNTYSVPDTVPGLCHSTLSNPFKIGAFYYPHAIEEKEEVKGL